jgi:hypothetical protein
LQRERERESEDKENEILYHTFAKKKRIKDTHTLNARKYVRKKKRATDQIEG